jgi:hypothetical protein
MYRALDPVSLYVTLLDKQLRLDPWTRRRVLSEVEDHLREAESDGRECNPETFFGDHQQLARELMLAWLERRYLSLKLLLVVAAVVTALAMFAIKTLTAGTPLIDGQPGAATYVHALNRGAGLVALVTIGTALWGVRARKFDLGRVDLFTRLTGAAALLLGTSVAGEIFTVLPGLPSIPPGQLLPIAALLLIETVAVSMTFGMWGLAHRILAGLK